MSSQEADRELYYQLMDAQEDEERQAWREALEPALNLERELLGGLPENKALLYSNVVSALCEVVTARMVLLEANAFDCGHRGDPVATASAVQRHLSEVKAEAERLSAFLAEHNLGSGQVAGQSSLELFV